ncbi:MAG TPA: ATP-binding protein [Opitutus sp.]|nr:ATP-binding protein [Opitutus sp.]
MNSISQRHGGSSLLLLALLVLAGPTAFAASPAAPIETAADFWGIPMADRNAPHEMQLELTALYYDAGWRVLWAIDREGSQAYLPVEKATPRIRSGQHFMIAGSVVPSRGLDLAAAKITLLPDQPLPAPLSTLGDFANADRFNGRRVIVEAYVNTQAEIGSTHLQLELAVEGSAATARVQVGDSGPIPQVAGALVRLTGVYVFDTPAVAFHPTIWVPDSADVQILGWLDHDARFQGALTPIEDLYAAPVHRPVHIAGKVLSQNPGVNVVVRDATGQATLLTAMTRPLQPGDPIEAIGFPATEGVTPVLRACLYRPANAARPPGESSRGLALLRLADQVRQLSLDDSARGYPARLTGVVTWAHPDRKTFFLLDPSGSIAVQLADDHAEPPTVGSRLTVTGHSTLGTFAPAVAAESLVSIESIPVPPPQPIALEQALSGLEEDQWVSLRGYARTVRREGNWDHVTISTPDGEFVAIVPASPRVDSLAGAVLDLSGVSRATTDARHQLTGVELWVPSGEEIDVVEPRLAQPFALPLTPLADLRRFHAPNILEHRIRVTGIVVGDEPGVALHLQDGTDSLLVLTSGPESFAPGDRVEAVGFPTHHGRRHALREALCRQTGRSGEPPPAPISQPASLRPDLDGCLVRVEAFVTALSPQPAGLRLLCQAGDTAFTGVWKRRDHRPPLDLVPGCKVALTGVYVLQLNQNSEPQGFELRLRASRDIAIVQPAPWWTAGRVGTVVAVLSAASVLGLAWVYALRRRVQHQTTQIRRQFEKAERLEAEIARASKLDSLGVLAGGIAHDFNNLLTVILGNLSLVLGDRDLSAENDEFLRQGERAAYRARDLTQQLLTFAKGGEPVRGTHTLPEIVREATGFALHGSPIRAEFDVAPDAWPVHADRGQISQVIHNIVLNARHAMTAGGRIHLMLRNDDVTPDAGLPLKPGRYLLLEIRDEGTGISSEHLPRIFDPYFTTKRQGSGLGLATAYSVIKRHAGHVAVESRLGEGTTFRIWIPAASAEASAAPRRSDALPHLRGRALIMDDEVDVRKMAGAMLKRLGLEVTATADGTELVAAYRTALGDAQPFSIVIADLTVPGAMGGREAVAALRQLDPGVRAVASSGYSNDPVMANFRDYGFVARIPKPYEFAQFASTIAAVIDGENPAGPT